MQIQVLMFAAAREAAQSDSLCLEVTDGACAKDVLDAIATNLPSISALVPSCRLAIDGEYVSPKTMIDPSRELALIPPVSGG
jgi:molybdopterin converting factor small subunit